MTTPLRHRMIEDMQLRGLADKTQEAYLRAARQLAEHFDKSPKDISEEELRQYFLYLQNDKKVSASTFRIALSGIKLLFQHTLRREWPTLDLVRPRQEKKLPVVLGVAEVRRILVCLHHPPYRVCLSTIYACGLRLGEGVRLQVGDIDSERRMLHIRQAKGAKDRYVPLPKCILEMLHWYWNIHRHPDWLFPAKTPLGVSSSTATRPMSYRGVQRSFKAALRESGVHKQATVHTLRHSYATHLLEARVNLRIIQAYLGHSSPKTTAIYTHLTRKTEDLAAEAIEQVMGDLQW